MYPELFTPLFTLREAPACLRALSHPQENNCNGQVWALVCIPGALNIRIRSLITVVMLVKTSLTLFTPTLTLRKV